MDFRIGDDIQEGGTNKNKGDIFKIIIVVVVALIIGLLVFLVVYAMVGEKKEPIPEVTTTTLKANDNKVVEAYKMVTYGANGKRNELFIKNKEVHSQDFNNLQKYYYAMQYSIKDDFTDTLNKDSSGKKIYSIPRDKVKSYMIKFFGPDASFEEDTELKLTLPFEMDGSNVATMKYNSDKDAYDVVFDGKDTYTNPNPVSPFYGEVSEAKETSNGVLEIKENIIFLKVSNKGNDTYDIGIYKDHDFTNEVEIINGVTKISLAETPIRINEYAGRCGVITYTFMKNGNSYYYVMSKIE